MLSLIPTECTDPQYSWVSQIVDMDHTSPDPVNVHTTHSFLIREDSRLVTWRGPFLRIVYRLYKVRLSHFDDSLHFPDNRLNMRYTGK